MLTRTHGICLVEISMTFLNKGLKRAMLSFKTTQLTKERLAKDFKLITLMKLMRILSTSDVDSMAQRLINSNSRDLVQLLLQLLKILYQNFCLAQVESQRKFTLMRTLSLNKRQKPTFW